MSQGHPEALARDAGLLLLGGLVTLPTFALVFYRPDGPRWPHHVVDGLAWVIVVTAGVMLAVAGAEKLIDILRRRLSP